MARNGGKPTVEQIAWKLQWSVAAVAAGLRVLLQQREIIEDVDLETGEFMYYLTSAITPENLADDLERRIAQAARSAGLPLGDCRDTALPGWWRSFALFSWPARVGICAGHESPGGANGHGGRDLVRRQRH
jgi:hypothetical protein